MDFALFVSAIAGHCVPRWGTQSAGMRAEFIGVSRDPKDATKLVWDEKTIVPITELESIRYGREYRGAIRDGGLLEHSAEEFAAQSAAEEERAKQRIEEAEKAKAAALDAEANEPPPATTDATTEAPVTISGAGG